MATKKYTKHGLTGPMLKRLSQLNNGHEHLHGNSLTAVDRGLVTETRAEVEGRFHPVFNYEITDAGRQALAQARAEGW